METIDIDIDDDLLFSLMILAHERDITLNQNINFILLYKVYNIIL